MSIVKQNSEAYQIAVQDFLRSGKPDLSAFLELELLQPEEKQPIKKLKIDFILTEPTTAAV